MDLARQAQRICNSQQQQLLQGGCCSSTNQERDARPKGTRSCKGELPLGTSSTNPWGRWDQTPPPIPGPIDVLWGCRVQASQLLGAILRAPRVFSAQQKASSTASPAEHPGAVTVCHPARPAHVPAQQKGTSCLFALEGDTATAGTEPAPRGWDGGWRPCRLQAPWDQSWGPHGGQTPAPECVTASAPSPTHPFPWRWALGRERAW